MTLSARARTLARVLPVGLATAAVAAVGITTLGSASPAQASPVLAANLRFMHDAHTAASDGPPVHTMVVPAPAGVDPTTPTSTTALAAKAGLLVDPTADPVPANENPALVTAAATTPAGTPHMTNLLDRHVTPSCTGTGTDGNRVQVVYAYETTNRFPSMEAVIRNEIANIDDVFALSSAETGGGKRVRWVADSNCVPQIQVVQVPTGQISYAATGGTNWNAFKNTLASKGLDNKARKYLVFGDAPAADPGICGLGDLYTDTRKTGNYNDGQYAQYGAVFQACFAAFPNSQTSAGHELVHTLGAVQAAAPNASLYGHCYDDGDLMCYPDGSPNPIRQVCPAAHEPLLDCNHDDYFSTNPPAGSWLANNWNTADSSFLDTVTALAPLPTLTVTGPATGVTGQAVTFTVNGAQGPYEWAVNGTTVPGVTGPTFSYTPKYADRGTRTITARTVLADGRKTAGVTTVQVNAAPAPTVTFTTAPATLVSGVDTPFAVTATGPDLTYAWTLPTRCTAPNLTTAQIALRCTLASGTSSYGATVSVKVTQGDGQTVTGSKSITVGHPPLTATISGPTGTLRVGKTYDFTVVAQGSTNPTASWNDTGKPTTWIEQGYFNSLTTKVTPRQAGTATIEAFVYAPDTGKYLTVTRALTAQAMPTATISGPTAPVVGTTATYTATVANGPAASYQWTSAQGWITGSATGAQVTLTPKAVSTDTLTVTVTATDGTKATKSFTVTGASATPVVQGTGWSALAGSGTSPVTLSATLTNTTTKKPLASTTVTVQRAWYGSTSYATAATVKTDKNGKVTWKAPADRAANYRFVYAGTTTTKAATSAARLVKMATKSALSVKTGYPTTFTGSVLNAATGKPVPTGTAVAIKVKWYGTTKWVTAANAKTDKYGKFTWKWYAKRNGYFQVVYAGNASTLNSASSAPLVRIPTKVTMSVKAGRPNTLTGRLLTGAGTAVKSQYLTLQYRAYGTSTWRTAAKYKTSSTGYVKVKVQPKKKMYYRWVYSGTSTGYLGATSAQGYVKY